MKRLLLILPLALGLVAESARAAMFDAFLKIDGVDGESADDRHKNEIEILSFQWGMAQPGTNSTASGGGGGAGKVSFQDITFATQFSKASPKLMLFCASGQHFSSAKLAIHRSGEQQPYMTITLSDCFISSYQTGGSGVAGDVVPTDQVSVNFTKIEFKHVAPDGTLTSGEATRPTITQ